MEEPSVLDYLKARLAGQKTQPPAASGETIAPEVFTSPPEPAPAAEPPPARTAAPALSLAALGLALAAQRALEPRPDRTWPTPAAAYAAAGALAAWASWRGEWAAAEPPQAQFKTDPLTVKVIPLIIGLAAAGLCFLASGSGFFTGLNLGLWVVAIASLAYAFWLPEPGRRLFTKGAFSLERAKTWLRRVSPAALGLAAVLIVAAFFRFYRLSQVPAEMNSDHAEKILDILRLLAGQAGIFFPNNGGREPLEMYLAAGLHRFFNVRLDFMALKMVTASAGFLALPLIYLLGKETANRRAGLLAAALAGAAYWPNVVSRLGLRLPFYMLFTGLVIYFLLKGLRTANRNPFILAGLALGLSMYGYSADRVLPLVGLLAVTLYLLHPVARRQRRQTAWFTAISLILAIVVALPLARYAIEQPEAFFQRSLTRLTGAEQALPGPAWSIFLNNLGRALAMFSWSNGDVWTASIPYRPALEVVSGALFWLGLVLTLTAYLRRLHWLHLFLPLSIPLLMLPSILSLAFPIENPNLYRTAGAVVPVFLLAGIALDGLMTSLEQRLPGPGRQLAWGLAGVLLIISTFQSYDLVFNQYRQQYQLSAWNSSEMGQVVQNFAGTVGSIDDVWIMGYPYWVDTRLVGINAGYPLRDFAMFTERLSELPDDSDAKLFFLHPSDQAGSDALQRAFPGGVLSTYPSKTPSKDFLVFFVQPPQN